MNKFLVTLALLLTTIFSWGQVWTYNFGTGTGTHTSSTASTTFLPTPPSGTARVRVGTNPGSITMANPGLTSLGSDTELQITSNTSSTSTTKFSIYDYTSSKIGYVKFKIAFSGGTNGVYKFSLGDGANYSDNLGIGTAQIFAGIEWTLGASNTISYKVLNASTYGTTGISNPTTLFVQNTSTVYQVEIYANNTTSSTNYFRSGTSYSLSNANWDLWVDGVRVGTGLAKGGLGTNVIFDSYSFNHQNSVTAPGTIYIDDIEYSNTLPVSYSVSYNGNSNTGGSAPTDGSSPYAPSSTVTVLGNTGFLTRTGYIFSGWNTLANGLGTTYNVGDTFTISANTTLYAKWTAIVVPTVTTTAVSSITTTAASSGGNVTADGGASVSPRGVYFGTSANPTSGTSDGTGLGSFTSSLSSLSVNTLYYYRAYATNSAGTGYGTESSFYTLANAASAPTVNTPTNNSLNVAITAGDGNPAATTYAIHETVTGLFVQADGTLGASPVWQTAATWSTITVTGLTTLTTYTFEVKARNGDNTETAYSTTTNGTTTASFTIGWCNLQWPTSQTISEGDTFTVYARVYSNGITNAVGQGAGINAWIGYSTSNDINSGSWTWVAATYNADDGANNDEYNATIGSGITPGTYYYVSRFQIGSGAYSYGGTNNDFWGNTSNSAPLTVNSKLADWCNIQWPTSGSINEGGTFNVYAQVFESGITNPAGQASGITGWIGVCAANTNPNSPTGWTWIATSYNGDSGNNDEYIANIASGLTPGTYYYASRFQLTGSTEYKYGGTGGVWNNDSGVLTVNALAVDWCNVQYPTSGSVPEGGTFNVYAQVFESGVTNPAGQGSGITGWIGVCAANTNPNSPTGWTWIATTYNGDSGNNDEYLANIAGGLTPGTYYYASRFLLSGASAYQYGGTGGFWNNDSGVLTITSNLVDWCNVQLPITPQIVTLGSNLDVYAQVRETGITYGSGNGGGMSAWIGYSSTDSNPNGVGWTWVVAPTNSPAYEGSPTYNIDNDEYFKEMTSGLALGTYYMASRFQMTGSTEYSYGGTAGVWNNDNLQVTIIEDTCNELYFSEYCEGSSNDKYLEIYNPTASSVNLADYVLRQYNNGSATPTYSLTLSGTLAAFDVYIVANSSSNATIIAAADLPTSSNVMTYNGDDAISLYKTSLAANVDVIGQIGTDPGSQWGSGLTSTEDNILVRKVTIQKGDNDGTDAFDPSIEWNGYAINTYTYMGSHDSNCDTSPKLTITPSSLTGFTYIVGNGPSTQQSFTVSGINLTANVVVTAPASYEVSTTSGSGFGSSVTLTPTGATLATTTVYVRLISGLSAGTYAESATVSSTGGTSKTVTLNGTVTQPTITLSTTTISGLTYVVSNGPSTPISFTVAGTNLLSNVTLVAPTNFEISLTSGSGYTGTLNLTPTANTLAATTIYVRLIAGLSLGTYTGTLTANSTSATEKTIALNGTVTNSAETDIITAGGEATTVSSMENDATITTTADGTQVWQFTIREGGSDLTDADNLATIVSGITFSQNTGNAINDWNDAILACALFDGSTLISNTPTITSTQIQFVGLNYTVAEGTSATLSLRISIQTNPNNTGGNLDGDDFVFNIANTNVTADAAGSSFAGFAVASSTNDIKNVLDVTATQLNFTVQASDIGQNSVMNPLPTVSATDANGNLDLGFTGSVSLISGGTMTATTPLAATAGVVIFTDIIHTALATDISLTASATGLTSAVSNLFDVLEQTILESGDLAILAVNTNVDGLFNDQVAFVSFKDINPGTKIYLTDNGYEREFAGEWGGTEGLLSVTRTGSVLPKGSIIVIEGTVTGGDGNINDISEFNVYTCGVIDNNWTKTALSGGSIGGFNLNVDDDIWILQGGTWTNSTSQHSTYDGNVLYGWTESGWQTAPGGGSQSSKWSTLFPGMHCFTTLAPVGNAKVKFDDPDTNGDFASLTNARLDWISLINDTANWDTYADNTAYNAGGFNYKGNTGCPQMTIVAGTYTEGVWTGHSDEDWFNCENWQTFIVPTETVDVVIADNTPNNGAKVNVASTFATLYSSLAKAKNITITGEKVILEGNVNNKLEVHGDLVINGGELDMSDGTLAADGQLYVYGNWDRQSGLFTEGDGTVHLIGSSAQTVNATTATPEDFANLVIGNDMTSDDFQNAINAYGNLNISTGKTVTVKTEDLAYAFSNLTVDGTFIIENKASFVQEDDAATVTNNGTTIVHKTTSAYNAGDYTYFSSPIVGETVTDALSGFAPLYYYDAGNYLDMYNANSSTGVGFPQNTGTPDGFDDASPYDWQTATGTMTPGVGYIARGGTAQPSGKAVQFTATGTAGRLNNGVVSVVVEKDAYTETGGSTASELLSNNNANLIGNPYPSAVDLVELYTDNTNILTGSFYFWSHSSAASSGVTGPWLNNYDSNDFATYNATGTPVGTASGNGGPTPNGFAASGQGFIATIKETYDSGTHGNLQFNNSQRSITNTNTQFFRTGTSTLDGIWLNLKTADNETRQIMVGFEEGASSLFDAYDSPRMENGVANEFYSLVSNTASYKLAIQRVDNFTNQKIIPLGLELVAGGTQKISLDHVQGVFAQGQAIYLEDKYSNIIHNLGLGAYSFTQAAGDNINDRFVLRFVSNTLGIDDDLEQVVIYPNPSEGKFYLNYAGNETLEIEIYDLTGKQLQNHNLLRNGNAYVIDLSQLQSGIYLAKIAAEGKQITYKLVVE